MPTNNIEDNEGNEEKSVADNPKSNNPPTHWSNKPFPGWLQMLIFFTWIMAMIFFVVPEFIKMFGKVKTTVSDTMEYQSHKNICTQLIKIKSPYPDFVNILKVKLTTHDKDKGFYLYQVDARQNNQQGLPQNEMYFVGFISKGDDVIFSPEKSVISLRGITTPAQVDQALMDATGLLRQLQETK